MASTLRSRGPCREFAKEVIVLLGVTGHGEGIVLEGAIVHEVESGREVANELAVRQLRPGQAPFD